MKLSIKNLCLERGGREIVSGISVELRAGDALVVSGQNGSGKSTTLRGMAGLLPARQGTVSLFDETGKQFENDVREYCHYLGHDNAMKPALTVRENLDFWQRFCGEPELAIEDALEVLELSHATDLPFSYLSAGQKRRVGLARLLVSDRPVWILDEPAAGLDLPSVENFAGIAKEFCGSGGILIAATHQPLGIRKAKTLEIASGTGRLKP